MKVKNIITGQIVHPEMLARAEELRRNQTPAEAKLWQCLRAGRLGGYHFRRQQVIDIYIVDFYCHDAGLVVELDGGVHFEQEEYDRERDKYLNEHGLRVLRFLNTQIDREFEMVLGMILEACEGVDRGPNSAEEPTPAREEPTPAPP